MLQSNPGSSEFDFVRSDGGHGQAVSWDSSTGHERLDSSRVFRGNVRHRRYLGTHEDRRCGVRIARHLCLFPAKDSPRSVGERATIRDILNLDALGLMKDRSFLVFVLGSLLICIPLAFYYNFTNIFLNEVGMPNPVRSMTFGQMSEILFMLVMPFFLVRLGVKKMLLFGMIAWALRYVLFAKGDADTLIGMLYAGIILHGICYDFFFVTGHIHVDNVAPKKIQASAQGFIALITYGLGLLIGTWISGYCVKLYETTLANGEIVRDWGKDLDDTRRYAAVVIVVFAIFFKEPESAASSVQS